MYIFHTGKEPFQKFLSNLTPQGLLLSLAFYIFGRISQCGWDWGLLIIGLIPMLLGLAAAWVNFTTFNAGYSRYILERRIALRRGINRPVTNSILAKNKELFSRFIQTGSLFIEAGLLVASVQFGFIAVISVAILNMTSHSGLACAA